MVNIKKTTLHCLLALALGFSASSTSAAPQYRVMITRIGFNPTTSPTTTPSTSTPSTPPPLRCQLPWGLQLANGSSISAFSASSVTFPNTCDAVTIVESCVDGTLSSPMASQNCEVVPTVALLADDQTAGGKMGVPYSYDFSKNLQIGDVAIDSNVTWTRAGGSIPPGLSLSQDTGIISGTPTSSGYYTFTLQASYKYMVAQAQYSIYLDAASCTLPWGATLTDGGSTQAYTMSSVTYPSTCLDVRVMTYCRNGELSVPQVSKSCAGPATALLTTPQQTVDDTPYQVNIDMLRGKTPDPTAVWNVQDGTLPPTASLAPDGTLQYLALTPGTYTAALNRAVTANGVTNSQVVVLTIKTVANQ